MQERIHLLDVGRMAYGECHRLQRSLVEAKKAGDERDYLILVEHPPVVTLGRTAKEAHLNFPREALAARGVEVFDIERGGDVTYHGPGQLVGYPIIDLRRAGLSVHGHLRLLEVVLIEILAGFGIAAYTRKGLTGVWCDGGKLAAIGIAVTRWISYHGFALNVNVNPADFAVIVPCGLSGEKVTSMREVLGAEVDMDRVRDCVLKVLSERLSTSRVG